MDQHSRNPEVKEIVNGDVDNWLKTAPFKGLWDPNDNDEGKSTSQILEKSIRLWER